MWRLAELALALRARHRPRGRLFWVRSRKQLFGAPERTAESDRLLGKVAPYGVYDIAANTGWINLGITHDTAAFAVESIRRWWQKLGRARYPDALPGRAQPDHHRRLRRVQRRAGQTVEARTATLRQ